MAALDKVREANAKEEVMSHSDFRTTVQGGAAQFDKTGKAMDNIIGLPRGQRAKEFLRRHFENDSFRCSIAKHRRAAGVL
eukprot:10860120-Lingulodinium_polyedra.AAC.1